MNRKTLPMLVLLAVALTSIGTGEARAQSRFFLRGGAGYAWGGDTVVRDLDCMRTQPPALFGCGAGVDGRPLGARGDLGHGTVLDVAPGLELSDHLRVELDVTYHAGLELDAQANFLGVSGEQPVRADVESLAALATVLVDLGPAAWRVRPFAGLGAGLAHNRIGKTVYAFPSISPDSTTAVRGGRQDAFAWSATVGAAWRLGERLHLDLTLRYADLGSLSSAAGPATIRRPGRELRLDIDGTRARIETVDLGVSVRYRF